MKLPRFTLRDLFWLVLVVGMGCAWFVSNQMLKSELESIALERDELAKFRVDVLRHLNQLGLFVHRSDKEAWLSAIPGRATLGYEHDLLLWQMRADYLATELDHLGFSVTWMPDGVSVKAKPNTVTGKVDE